MGDEPVDPNIDKIALTHAKRILAALEQMSIGDVRRLVDEIETQVDLKKTDVHE